VVTVHFIHLYGILFVAEVLIMLVIGYFFPVSTPWTYKNNEKVDMQPWRLRVPCATTLISCVIGLYLLFSPLGIVGGLSQLFLPLVGGLIAVNIAVWWHYGVSKLVSTPAS
jgi:SSS family solute:Na+ symporter